MYRVITETGNFPEIQKRNCKYCPQPRGGQVRTSRIFTLLSRTEAIGSVTFVCEIQSVKCVLTFYKRRTLSKLNIKTRRIEKEKVVD